MGHTKREKIEAELEQYQKGAPRASLPEERLSQIYGSIVDYGIGFEIALQRAITDEREHRTSLGEEVGAQQSLTIYRSDYYNHFRPTSLLRDGGDENQ